MIETPVPCWMDRGPTVETVDAMTRGLRNPRPRFSTTVWTHSKIGGSGEDLSFNLSFDRPYRCVAHPPTTSFCSSFFVVHGVWILVRQDEQQSGRTRWRRRRRYRQLRCRPDGRLSRPGGPSNPGDDAASPRRGRVSSERVSSDSPRCRRRVVGAAGGTL